ncbi:cytochrome P450 [Flammula alnicola]|nr:cytochrome P450 [Flammula alnicola]
MLLSLLLLALVIWLSWRSLSTSRNTPPGPKRLPILGNFFQVPTKHPFVRFFEWKKIHGDVIYLQIFGRNLLVLNSKEAAVDLFEKRSAIYSERPYRAMAHLCGFGSGLVFQNYSDVTRNARKLIHGEMGQQAVNKHQLLLEQEVRVFVHHISTDSSDIHEAAKRLAAAIILKVSYGHVARRNDPLIDLSSEVLGYLDKVGTPNRYLVDALPILRHIPEWFPGAQFQREARNCRGLFTKMSTAPFHATLQQVKEGIALPSLVATNVEKHADTEDLTEEALKPIMMAATGLFSGGSLTTVAAIMSFFLAMVLHPRVQRRAQEELDTVLGGVRLPKLSDRASLPYLECIIKELLRWRPGAPLAAHTSLVDDVYRGWKIPAGTVIMANAWAFTRDEDIYPDADEFIPERFMRGEVEDPRNLVFGFGRRRCPGMHFIDNLLWILAATTLCTADIVPALNSRGQPSLPTTDFTSGLVPQPLPFECRIVPRSAQAAELVSDAIAHEA